LRRFFVGAARGGRALRPLVLAPPGLLCASSAISMSVKRTGSASGVARGGVPVFAG